MTQFELDTETYLLYPLFALGAASTLGIVSTDILGFINLGNTVLTTAGIDWSIARGLSLVALLSVIINRDDPLNTDAWGAVEVWAFYVTIGLVIAPPFFPALQSTLAGEVWAFVAFTVQSIGFALITYIN